MLFGYFVDAIVLASRPWHGYPRFLHENHMMVLPVPSNLLLNGVPTVPINREHTELLVLHLLCKGNMDSPAS
jgi:hypothetical protein